MDAAYWISKLKLEPHPEEGYYRRFYESHENHECEDGRGVRPTATCIWFLMKLATSSKIHRLKSDEIWFYHSGNPMQVVIFHTDKPVENIRIGIDDKQGMLPSVVVPKGKWFLSFPTAGPFDYSLVSCVVSPGFDFKDFELDPDYEKKDKGLSFEKTYHFCMDDFDDKGKNSYNKYFDDLIAEWEEDFANTYNPYFANEMIGNYSVMNLLKISMQMEEHQDMGTLISENFNLSLKLDDHSERQTIYAIGSRISGNFDNPLFLTIDPTMNNGEVYLKYNSDNDDNEEDTTPNIFKPSQEKTY